MSAEFPVLNKNFDAKWMQRQLKCSKKVGFKFISQEKKLKPFFDHKEKELSDTLEEVLDETEEFVRGGAITDKMKEKIKEMAAEEKKETAEKKAKKDKEAKELKGLKDSNQDGDDSDCNAGDNIIMKIGGDVRDNKYNNKRNGNEQMRELKNNRFNNKNDKNNSDESDGDEKNNSGDENNNVSDDDESSTKDSNRGNDNTRDNTRDNDKHTNTDNKSETKLPVISSDGNSSSTVPPTPKDSKWVDTNYVYQAILKYKKENIITICHNGKPVEADVKLDNEKNKIQIDVPALTLI